MGTTLGGVTIAKAFIAAGLATGVDPALLSSLCYEESHHKVNALVAQDGGSPSYGICQVKLRTAQALGYTGWEKGLMDLSLNSLYAAKYLAKQKRRYGTWEQALSAYNAGHLSKKNHRYVRRVIDRWKASQREARLCGGEIIL